MSKKPEQGNQKTLEEIYQKKDLREHVLLRPDSYIGSIEMQEQSMWILSGDTKTFEERVVTFIPGLYKIFDEIIVNASDNYINSKQSNIVMDTIRVIINEEKNLISVWNNGKGIPVLKHEIEKIYIPDLVFGNLLTGSNYNDDEKKITGGRNGYGAKLANIFSSRFIVECEDSENQKYYKAEWTDNMSKKGKEIIEKCSKKTSSTCITFYPDLKKFNLEALSYDMVNLMKKRVYDIAGLYSNRIKVYLNDERIELKSFKEYVNKYLDTEDESLKIYDKNMTTDRWEILVSFSEGQFKQVSFVNSICTSKGGTHVNYVTDQIVKSIMEEIEKKHKKISVKNFQIKQNLWIFVNCLVENPAFDSQTKETLTTKVSQFGSKPDLTKKFIDAILKTGIIDQIVQQAKARENAQLAKQMKGVKKSRLLGIDKLDDANDAGTKNSKDCTLILTEGDSAKALAMAGVNIIGRDKYGVFPLRGKLLNVRDAATTQIMANQEIQSLIKIIGLQLNKSYENINELRYGCVMIMTDQDHDGSHIKGLIINFIQHFWPSLFQMKGFLKEFVTPIIKVTNNRNSSQQIPFFSIGDFKEWQRNINLDLWTIKYYKGLGTSNEKEAVEYFSQIERHRITFDYVDIQDNQSIELCFNKKMADKRKEWLADYDPEIFVNHSIKNIRFHDFVNLEYIHYSNSDNIRSIPSIVDGMKPGQRKILFSCFKRNLVKEIKVAQLSGYVAEKSAYHHGEQSLATSIIALAQNFVGSNNINYLVPNGQFGTRNLGGKDHAASRYLFTNLNKITRFIFPEEDDHVLKYLEDENLMVEPEWYMPIIPMVLVNGSSGIGTGWSTDIPCYNPREITEQIKQRLNGKEFTDLNPWYKGFVGEMVESQAKNSSKQTRIFDVKGIYEISDTEQNVIEIKELPIGKWTKDYKQFLESMIDGDNPLVQDMKEYHTQNRIHFWIELSEGKLEALESKNQFDKIFKLSTTIQTSNMVLFTPSLKLRRYQTTMDIMEEFFHLRLSFYEKRKSYLISKIAREVEILENKVKFILGYMNDKIKIKGLKRNELVNSLIKFGLTPFSKFTQVESTKLKAFRDEENKDQVEEEEEVQGDSIDPKEFNYLLQMPLWCLTYEKIEQLKKETDKKNKELIDLKSKTIQTMWLQDLDAFIKVLDQVEEQEENDRNLSNQQGKAQQKNRKKKPNKVKNDDVAEKKKKSDNYEEKPKKDKPKKKSQNEDKKVKKQEEQKVNKEEEIIQPPKKQLHEMTLVERAKLRMEQQESESLSKFQSGYSKVESQFSSTSLGKLKKSLGMDIKKREIKSVLDEDAEENVRIDGFKPSREIHKNTIEDDDEFEYKNIKQEQPKQSQQNRRKYKIVSSSEDEVEEIQYDEGDESEEQDEDSEFEI